MTIIYLGCPASERPETEAILAHAGLAVTWMNAPHAVLGELAVRPVPVVIDLSRGAAALQLAREIRAQYTTALVFAVVDPRRPDLTTEAVLAGSADVFARPLGARRVVNAIERELHHHDPKKRAIPGDLYGHSPAMQDVMALITRASGMRAGVTITGEDGSGRQTVARSIHAASQAHGDDRNSAGAFVSIDCRGHDNGDLGHALFGANGDVNGVEKVSRDSALYQARHGSLYLQNIADIPGRTQARLARLLRDREAVIAETGEIVHLDVRPMAGVDLGIDSAVRGGRIRDALFKKISVVRIEMPSLRQRRDDIPALANFFLREICAEDGVPPKTLSRAALTLLAALPWRGNAEELRSLLSSVVQGIHGGRNLGLEDVLAHVRLDGGSIVFPNGGSLKQARAKFERDYIAAILERNQGRIRDAAMALGIQRTNLYRKMRSLHIKPARTGRASCQRFLRNRRFF